MTTRGPDPLQDALDLQARIRELKALLEVQRWQFEVLNDRLYSVKPAGIAARRLLDLKRSEAQAPAPQSRKHSGEP